MIARALITAGLVLGLAACSNNIGQTTGKVTTSPGAPTSAAAKERTAALGQTYTYDDGVAVTASAFAPFTRSDAAVGGKPGDKFVKTTIKITNGGDKIIDLALASSHLRTGAGGVEAEQVFDASAGLTEFSGSLAPGKSASAVLGFAVAPANVGEATLEVQPGLDYESVMFEGKIA